MAVLAPSGISASGRGDLAALTARGRRLISVADAAAALRLDERTAARKLARWTAQGWLRRVRRGLYIPVPIEAEDPDSWSEDPLVLAAAVWHPCYFTGWTAANHWGLTEQLFRTTVVKTAARVRTTEARLLEHDYLLTHVDARLIEWGTKPVWRDDRRVLMADAARTVVDALDAPALCGGVRTVADVLSAYLDEFDWRTLIEYGDRLGNRAVFKRLGYLVEATSGPDELVPECRARVSAGFSLLEPSAPAIGRRVVRWGLRLNVDIVPLGVS